MKNQIQYKIRLFSLFASLVFFSGCASMGVKPWEHDLLAQEAMQVDPNPMQSSFDDHIYFSKEASSGGRSFGGGGCGCN